MGDFASSTRQGLSSRPVALDLLPTPRRLPVQFTGSGSEYFRLWIVNLLLTLVTLSLYHPFAKARKLRYFHANTLVGDEALGFHGNPWAMLRGYLLVIAFFGCYALAGQVSPGAAMLAAGVFALLWPAMWLASMRFRLANTSWRGLRLRFTGDLAGTYGAFLPALPLGIALAASAGASDDQSPLAIGGAMVLGVAVLASLLLSPLALASIKRYQHDHFAFADETARLTVPTRAFYGLFMRTGLISLAAGLLLASGAGVAAALGLAVGGRLGGVAAIGAVVLGLLGYLLLFALTQPYFSARLQNLLWNGTASFHLRFECTLRCRDLAWLSLRNLLLTVCTLGLYRPFAAVNTARLRLEAVHLLAYCDLDGLTQAPGRSSAEATGEAAADVLGVDIGL